MKNLIISHLVLFSCVFLFHIETTAQSWTIYNTSNSGIPEDDIWATAIDKNGDIWIGTQQSGIAKFGSVSV